MKRISLIIVFAFGIFLTKSYAQPTFYLSNTQFEQNCNMVAQPGDQICKQVRVWDFTDIIAIDFSINWDPTILEYQSITSLNPSVLNLSLADFDVSGPLVNNGQMTFSWESSDVIDCTDFPNQPPGISLNPDGQILFEICFTAQGVYTDQSPIDFSSTPLDQYVTRLNANCNDIGEFTNNCSVSVGVSPLIFNVTSASGQVGDQVCVDLSVEEFQEIVAMQFSMNWDCSVLEFASAETNCLNSWNIGQQVNIGACSLSASWFDTEGISLDDGKSILTLCFNLIGEGGQCSVVSVDNMPTDLEVINLFCSNNNGCDITELVNNGTICIEDFDENAISISMADETVCQGESFCVDLTVQDFDQILEMGFTATWNPAVLQLIDVQNIPTGPGNFPNTFVYPSGFFDNTQINQGYLGVHWEASSIINDVDLSNGTVIMSLCFTVIGDGGSNSIVSITSLLQEIIVRDETPPSSANIGINADNAVITVKPTQGITVSSSSITGFPGQNVCVDVSVINFDDIERAAFTVNYNDVGGTVLEYTGVQGFGLPDMSVFNFMTDNPESSIGFEWETFSTAVTVPDGTVIFQVCFDIIGDVGDCTEVTFSGEPFEIDIVSVNSGGGNIGLTPITGQVCVENPLEVALNPTDEFGSPSSVACVQFSPINFTQLTGTQFTINFDESVVEFLSVNGNGAVSTFTASSFDASNADSGEIGITWETNNLNGQTLTDGDSFFDVCFTIIGNSGDCSPIVVSDSPFFIDVTSAPTGNANLGLSSDPGSVCVTAIPTIIACTPTFVDCPGDNTGTIDLNIAGGSGNYDYQWAGPSIHAGNINDEPILTSLLNGTYLVTVTDQAGGGQAFSSCEVGISPDAPVADVGMDLTLDCDSISITVDASNSTQSAEVQYLWEKCSTGLVTPGDENILNATLIGNDKFKFTVTNFVTGCVVSDTIEIFNNVTPSVEGGPDTTLTCYADTVQLDGSNSTNSIGFFIEWTTGLGGVLQAGTENSVTPVAMAGGEYYIQVTHNGSGCFERDTVIVVEDMMPPNVDTGMPQALGCNDESVMLDASASGLAFTYEWTTDLGEICTIDPNQAVIEACAPAEYFLLVTDPENGCTTSTMVLVEADTLKPVSNAGLDTTLTCLLESVVLDGSLSTQDGNITYEWSENTIVVSEMISFETSTQGVYELIVMNEDNGCSAVSSVTVGEDFAEPVITAAAATYGELTCEQLFDTLSATADLMNVSIEWIDANSNTFDGATIEVMEGGDYSLIVTNLDNGCTAEDLVSIAVNQDTLAISAGDNKFINCVDDEVLLNGSLEDINANFIVQWSGCIGCLTNSDQLEPTASDGGIYTMTVQNTDNGCLSQTEVTVAEDMTQPMLLNPMSGTLTCETPDGVDVSVELQDANLVDVTIEWQFNSTPIPGANGLSVTALSPGLYTVTVTHDNSGCTDTQVISPDENVELPIADAGMDSETTCDDPMVAVDGSSSIIPNETNIIWTEIIANTPTPIGIENETGIIVDAGTYLLIVTDTTNGCVAIDSVIIGTNADFPQVDAGMDANLGCVTTSVSVTGSGSANDPVSFQWLDANMDPIPLGTTETIDFTAEGIYTLQVTNDVTGCSATDEVTVGFEIDGQPANAMSDSDDCSEEGVLIGNLPEGATGSWSGVNTGIIDDLNAEMANVSNLQAGQNTFIWTLSLGACIDYSTSSTTIETNFATLIANIDLPPAYPPGTIRVEENVLNNDISEDVTFNIVGAPTEGVIDSINTEGMVFWSFPEGFFGTAEVDYEICSEICPVCDTTFLQIEIPRETVDIIPNGITPNGDGLNDVFIFDDLVANPEKFPEVELIIFNRWGDEVFKAQPYLNNWGGENMDGKPLPDGTYYYILRLNIGQSEIIRGDVTVLR